ncbi:HD domain-containing protein [bacterium]|nr:HD domain-containing protein [bacterium]MBU1985486.1 HD domain-containing protein [bacterium]
MAQRMIDSVNKNEHKAEQGDIITPKDAAIIRFAALLHDIGHLPFSHVGEQAYSAVLDDSLSRNVDVGDKVGFKTTDAIRLTSGNLHEQLSARIIREDKEIGEAFKEYNSSAPPRERIDKDEVAALIEDTSTDQKSFLKSFIHSAIDADRLDFLSRDSYFVGSNYGRVETETIIRKLRFVQVKEGRTPAEEWWELCLDSDAGLVADHFLLSRFYWYAMLLGQPRILYLDLLTKNVMKYLINTNRICCIDQLDKLTIAIREKRHMHEFMELQDSGVIMAMRRCHNEWDGNDSISELEKELDTAIKVLMGGNLAHMFLRKQGLMEHKEYQDTFDSSRLHEAEKCATEELRKQEKIDKSRAFVKFVHKARNLHVWAPDCRGAEFEEDWRDHVLIKCDRDGHPKCVPIQLANTNVLHRIGLSRIQDGNKPKEKSSLVSVSFATFILWPSTIKEDQYSGIEEILNKYFGELTQPFHEELVNG